MKKKYKRERDMLIKRAEDLRLELKELNEQKKQIERRLMIAGSEIETIDDAGVIQVIHAEATAYGLYTCFSRDPSEEQIENAKKYLVEDLAKGMMENNIVQFIVHKECEPLGIGPTVGAKMYVVPWEQMRTRKIEIRRKL